MESTFSRLRINGLDAPLGVASSTLRLSWVVSREIGETDQIVVVVANSLRKLLSVSDVSDGLHTLPGDARSLVLDPPATRRMYWRVGHRDNDHVTWSDPSHVTFAPDFAAEGACWVTHSDLVAGRPEGDTRSVWFALDIVADPSDTLTLLHLATPGVADVRVDGHSLGRNILGPGYSDLHREVSAATHDLGILLPGAHTVTVEVASGPYWISPTPERYSKFVGHHQAPALLALLEQFGESTRSTTTRADRTRTGRGATVAAHWYGGEDFDAGCVEPWHAREDVNAIDASRDRSPTVWWPEHPPIQVVDVLSEGDFVAGREGVVADFGVNIAGVPELRWRSSGADRVVRVFPAEQIDAQGVDQDSTGTPIFDSIRIPAGTEGVWSPRFTYHGFRYLEVRGAADLEVKAHVVRATNERSGTFTSGDAFLERLHTVVDRAVQGNMHSVFTDCPHREKFGWLEQLHFCFDALARNFNVEAHLRDMLHHMRQAQLTTGAVPSIVPEFCDFSGHGFQGDDDAFRFDVNWGGAIVHLPLDHYDQYGDLRVVEDNVEAMKGYLAYLRSRETDGLINFGLGDWIALDTSAPRELIASHGYMRVLDSAIRAAELMRDGEWLLELGERFAAVTIALREREHSSPSSSQTELVILVDLAERRNDVSAADLAFAHLLERIASDGDAFTVGEVTFGLLIDVLQRRGLGDLIYSTISRPDVPGYGMQLARGVTALAETWSAERLAVGEG
ncbi:MAG: family 78 glycoside hydrolase catalytic domain, partial [Kineosporiaceae bacterium]|nr:family 78 glycoside hydrolase catalytic domain [Aeromicrobium sp.]